MIIMKPFAYITETYEWEGDSNVKECLVFFGTTLIDRYNKEHDPKWATFKLRAVKDSDGGYKACVRHALVGELIYENPDSFCNPLSAIEYLIEHILEPFEIREIEVDWLPKEKL
jgi:hypothetical protein